MDEVRCTRCGALSNEVEPYEADDDFYEEQQVLIRIKKGWSCPQCRSQCVDLIGIDVGEGSKHEG